MHWILFYEYVDDYLDRRDEFREVHLSLARSMQRMGFLVMAGAYADPADGAALIFKTDDRAIVEQFVGDDPYVNNGLVTSWTIRQWSVVVDVNDSRGFGQSRSTVWGN
ncbi:MAG: YciI-like protein [Ilumatobacteraceae bacterium]